MTAGLPLQALHDPQHVQGNLAELHLQPLAGDDDGVREPNLWAAVSAGQAAVAGVRLRIAPPGVQAVGASRCVQPLGGLGGVWGRWASRARGVPPSPPRAERWGGVPVQTRQPVSPEEGCQLLQHTCPLAEVLAVVPAGGLPHAAGVLLQQCHKLPQKGPHQRPLVLQQSHHDKAGVVPEPLLKQSSVLSPGKPGHHVEVLPSTDGVVEHEGLTQGGGVAGSEIIEVEQLGDLGRDLPNLRPLHRVPIRPLQSSPVHLLKLPQLSEDIQGFLKVGLKVVATPLRHRAQSLKVALAAPQELAVGRCHRCGVHLGARACIHDRGVLERKRS
eukprot:RCo035836